MTGKEISAVSSNVPSIRSWTSKGVSYTGSLAIVGIVENDTDPLHNVDLVLKAKLSAASQTGASKQVTEYTIASIDGDYTASIRSRYGNAVYVSSTTPVDETHTFIVNTLTRSTEPQTITGTISVSNSGGGTAQAKEFTLTVPPLKQNVTKNGARITYTYGGVKYDLLNYK